VESSIVVYAPTGPTCPLCSRVLSSTFKNNLRIFMYLKRIFKRYVCQVYPSVMMCLPLCPSFMTTMELSGVLNTLLSSLIDSKFIFFISSILIVASNKSLLLAYEVVGFPWIFQFILKEVN
jgi:hypothetical protein